MRTSARSAFAFSLFLTAPSCAWGATLPIEGTLDFVQDLGGATYSGVPLGTPFSGFIDDVTFAGQISDGTTLTLFTCCIAAGGIDSRNDEAIDAGTAAVLNEITGSSLFAAGQIYDGVDIVGDAETAGDGRIEVGISYFLDPDTFPVGSPGHYPFAPEAVRLAVFFIFEEDAAGEEIYAGFGVLQFVPEPAAVGLLLSAAFGLAGLRTAAHGRD